MTIHLPGGDAESESPKRPSQTVSAVGSSIETTEWVMNSSNLAPVTPVLLDAVR